MFFTSRLWLHRSFHLKGRYSRWNPLGLTETFSRWPWKRCRWIPQPPCPWSSPRKERNRKPPTGGNVVPRKQTIRVNPNEGKQGGIPEKEAPWIANPKGNPSGCKTELFPRCRKEKFQQRSELEPKETNSEAPAKAKRNPREGISGDFHSQVRSELAPKWNKFRGAWRKFFM